jgi:hypothetical protein
MGLDSLFNIISDLQFASGGQRTVMDGSGRYMAEREGFEPPIPFRVCLISSQVHSTGLCHLSDFVGTTRDPVIAGSFVPSKVYQICDIAGAIHPLFRNDPAPGGSLSASPISRTRVIAHPSHPAQLYRSQRSSSGRVARLPYMRMPTR